MHQAGCLELTGNVIGGWLQGGARFGHPRHQRARRDRQAVDVGDQLGRACVRQHLALRQMHAQGAYLGTILHRFAYVGGKGTRMQLAAAASDRQRLMLDHIERDRRHVEYLSTLPYLNIIDRQERVAALALARQRMPNHVVWLIRLAQRRAFTALLTTSRLARRLAQRRRFLGQPIGRWRLARVRAVHAQLRLDRVQAREQGVNETVLVFMGQVGEIEAGRLRWHDGIMRDSGTVYNCLLPRSLRLNSYEIFTSRWKSVN